MATLLLRLAAPLQSWGTDSKFEIRNTAREPSKSGVVGLLAAALGRKRDADFEDLNQLRFGVRVDQEGELLHDYHIASIHGYGPTIEKIKQYDKKPFITHRYYLSDAIFLVGLESEDRNFLSVLENAIKKPAFPLFLGRRSCPPSLPIVIGIRDKDLLTSLKNEEWLAAEWLQKRLLRRGGTLRIMLDAREWEQGVRIKDLPSSFDPRNRRFQYRNAIMKNIKVDDVLADVTDHDAMKELR